MASHPRPPDPDTGPQEPDAQRLPVAEPRSESDTTLPPLPAGVPDEINPADVMEIARWQTAHLAPQEVQREMHVHLAAVCDKHTEQARRFARLVNAEQVIAAQLIEQAQQYRAQILTLASLPAARRTLADVALLEGLQASLANLEAAITQVCGARDAYERTCERHLAAASAITHALQRITVSGAPAGADAEEARAEPDDPDAPMSR